ncbi:MULTISPECIES: hypothetical protein [Bacillus cereus group]|uniref:Uncharacterized protein n=1 Tax=Bacillus cereus (strain G9842) TaxID=405531 RepID=B7IZ18_BACC2|nr:MULTISPECIES: hypothetical protein [Bacillus cereus group]ACK98520.1 hypothetical protein BCG9842_0247 [Bacillus cereus G9842]
MLNFKLVIAMVLLLAGFYILFRGIMYKIKTKLIKEDALSRRNDYEEIEEVDDEEIKDELSFIKNLREPNKNNERIIIHSKQKSGTTKTRSNSDYLFEDNNEVTSMVNDPINDSGSHKHAHHQTNHHGVHGSHHGDHDSNGSGDSGGGDGGGGGGE